MNVQRNVVEDVIPELDENMTTIISMRGERKPPTVQEIFGSAPPSSAPVAIPGPFQSDGPRLMDTQAAREKFFQEKVAERPTQLSVSVPADSTRVVPIPDFNLPQPPDSSSEESVVATSPPSLSPDTGFQSELKSDNMSEDGKEDPDLSMDDVQISNRRSDGSEGSNLAKKIAKTFGFKDKDKESDDKSEVHLLSDVSRIKEDSDEDDDDEDKNEGKSQLPRAQ